MLNRALFAQIYTLTKADSNMRVTLKTICALLQVFSIYKLVVYRYALRHVKLARRHRILKINEQSIMQYSSCGWSVKKRSIKPEKEL